MRSPALLLAAAAVVLAGCASDAQPILIGDHRYPPLAANAPVRVFMKDADVHQGFDVVAEVSAMDLGKYQILTMQDALPVLEAKARATGADAIIVDNYQPVKSGIMSTGYSVQARAVRLTGNNRPATTRN
jgi:hypothetical protein